MSKRLVDILKTTKNIYIFNETQEVISESYDKVFLPDVNDFDKQYYSYSLNYFATHPWTAPTNYAYLCGCYQDFYGRRNKVTGKWSSHYYVNTPKEFTNGIHSKENCVYVYDEWDDQYNFKFRFKTADSNMKSIGIRPMIEIPLQTGLFDNLEDAPRYKWIEFEPKNNKENVITIVPQKNKYVQLVKNYDEDGNFGFVTCQLGDFPKSYVGDELNEKLNELFQKNPSAFTETGRTFPGFYVKDEDKDKHENINGNILFNKEYTFGQKNLCLVHANPYAFNEYTTTYNPRNGHPTFNNGFHNYGYDKKPLNFNDTRWCYVEPITWVISNWEYVEDELKLDKHSIYDKVKLVALDSLMSGIPFNFESENKYPSWKDSPIREILNNQFVNTAFSNTVLGDEIKLVNKNNQIVDELSDDLIENDTYLNNKLVEYSSPYTFNYKKLKNDELLEEYLKANTSIFLHGPSGVGKSTRIKELDPTATRITLRPQMNPEEIDGTLDRDNGTYIPPLWYQQLTEKCEAEPNRKHILFIDELTNVKPTIQSLVYSIVLDHAGKDGLWKLPENAVVVAAGNESQDNLAAHPMTNALFRRFCHIYYKVDKRDWLDWATNNDVKDPNDLKPNKVDEYKYKIHPAIIGFVSSSEDDILNQELDEDNPQIVTDPRKWEIASKVLYDTNNPNALEPAIGKELTQKFIEFSNIPSISISNIKNCEYVNGSYKADVAKNNEKKLFKTITGLLGVTKDDLQVTRQFIKDELSEDWLNVYDRIWANKDPERENIINNCKLDTKTRLSSAVSIPINDRIKSYVYSDCDIDNSYFAKLTDDALANARKNPQPDTKPKQYDNNLSNPFNLGNYLSEKAKEKNELLNFEETTDNQNLNLDNSEYDTSNIIKVELIDYAECME